MPSSPDPGEDRRPVSREAGGVERGVIQHTAPPPARRERPASAPVTWFFIGSSMFWPRVFILAFWIFGSELGRAFSSWVIPAIGFLILPWTTVLYAWTWAINSDGVHGWEWIVVACGLIADLLTWTAMVAVRSRSV
jgi:hypothetical protein